MAPKRQFPDAGSDGQLPNEKRNRVDGGASPIKDLSKTIEEARRRAQAAFQRSGLAAKPAPAAPAPAPPAAEHTGSQPQGIHPLLLGDAAKIQEKFRSLAPKFASIQANKRALPGRPAPPTRNLLDAKPVPVQKANPYLSSEADKLEGPKPKSMHRALQFHRPGKYVLQAEQIRRDEQMQALKERIQTTARKAGLQDELLDDERILRRPMPPDAEWWDLPLLPSKTYDDVPDKPLAPGTAVPDTFPLIEHDTSPVDHLVQHPIPIPPPTANIKVQPHGVILTKQEMKKMRRQRRAAEQQDKRDRIKMGLLPPDPPKVKLSNLMRVLGNEAIADPTKVEARVRREVAARHELHERTNAERMLTDEERRERRIYKTKTEEAKGIWCHVYRVRHLISPSHRFKVRKNAQQHHLSGLILVHPDMALVIVEGSAKALKAYKRLMLVRIDWTDPGRPKDQDDAEEPALEADPMDLSDNTCECVFEGPVRDRALPMGVVKMEVCSSDLKVKELLGPKLSGYWDVAKRSGMTEDK